MLFALIDYYRYRRQRGIYSPAYIAGRNGFLLSPETAPDPATFEAGDIYFTHRRVSTTSWVVMYLTASPWAHTGIFSGDGNVLEAMTHGVIEHPFTDYLDGRSYMSAYKPPYPDNESRAKAVAAARASLGAPYNWPGIARLGVNILIGRNDAYRVRVSADVLIILGMLSLPALRWRPWALIIATAAVVYLIAVVRNRPGRERMRRATKASPSRPSA